ncbi:hypothetical protein GCM10027446_06680 [Angustibacter peucedani]
MVDQDVVGQGLALALGAALYLAVAAYVFSHRRAVGGRALTLLLVAAGIWTICNAAEVSSVDPQTQEHWGDLKYVGIVLLPPALLSFAIEYTGRRRRMGARNVALLAVEPLLVLGLLAGRTTHDWVRSVPDDAPPGTYAVADTGPVFWVHLVYSYLMIVVAVGMLVAALITVTRRRAGAWLLIGSVLLPLVLNAAYNLGFDQRISLDPTPLGFSVAGLVLVWGFFRFRLSELVPVGRRQVVEQIPDAVVVLDVHGRVVDANPAAAELTGQAGAALVGRELLDVLPQLAGLLVSTPRDDQASGTCRLRRPDGSTADLAVTISPLPGDRVPATGRLVVLRDVTAQRDVERRLRELVSERTAIIETLQRGLYPRRTPEIPGLAVSAVLDPAEVDTSIGGDFVDVRSSGPSRWTLMVGDVVGKGASAATLTALARHTTVALTALGWTPAAVLGEVSRAIAVDERAAGSELDARFCTMALATVEPHEDGAEVVLSLGGHPRPMLVTRLGEVTEVGVPGSLLGVVDQPELHDVRLHLHRGECLVMFTDGVTEARRGDDVFGEERLAELLGRMTGAPPDQVVHEVVQAVRLFSAGEARDDVAVLALSVPPQ